MGRTTLAVVLVTALTMLNDTVRGHVQQVTQETKQCCCLCDAGAVVTDATTTVLHAAGYFLLVDCCDS